MYQYNATIYCGKCAESIMDCLEKAGKRPANTRDETTFDSSEWPKWVSHWEEFSHPVHCCACKKFLENSINTEGYDYTVKMIIDVLKNPSSLEQIDNCWEYSNFYNIWLVDIFAHIKTNRLSLFAPER